MRTVEVVLRTHQYSWLRRVAERDDLSVSGVIGSIIEACWTEPCRRPATKEYRAHVAIAEDHLDMLDRRAAEAGIGRSEMARRLIDESMRR